MISARMTDDTIFRLEKLSGKPISRGFDKIINQVLDQLEKRNDDVVSMSNTTSKEHATQPTQSQSRRSKHV